MAPPRLQAYDLAMKYLQSAKREDTGGNSLVAYEAYKEGIRHLLAAMKMEPPGRRKDTLRQEVTRHMTRAEQLKHKLGLGVSNQPSSQSSVPYQANIPPAVREALEASMLSSNSKGVSFADVVGLEQVKEALKEMVILPALRPDLFQGIRQPPRGLLLYGPPGNGKTFIARAVAFEAQATFFCISASSLVSKHFGEAEKLMKGLFALAREKAPSIVFIDEIDSILSRRGSQEHEASRRLKTEFLVQFDGADPACRHAHVVVIGATNVPEDLDEAVIRRLTRRIYVPMPDKATRHTLIVSLLQGQNISLSRGDLRQIVDWTANYSCSDIRALVTEAAMGPLRALGQRVATVDAKNIGPISRGHFLEATRKIRPSVSPERLQAYERWSRQQQGN